MTSKIYVKITEDNIGIHAIRQRISTSIKATGCIFMLAFTIVEIVMFKNVDLENLGQDHGKQHTNDPFNGEYQCL